MQGATVGPAKAVPRDPKSSPTPPDKAAESCDPVAAHPSHPARVLTTTLGPSVDKVARRRISRPGSKVPVQEPAVQEDQYALFVVREQVSLVPVGLDSLP